MTFKKYTTSRDDLVLLQRIEREVRRYSPPAPPHPGALETTRF